MSSLIVLATDQRALDHARQALELPEAALHPDVGAAAAPFIGSMPRLFVFGSRDVIDERLDDVDWRGRLALESTDEDVDPVEAELGEWFDSVCGCWIAAVDAGDTDVLDPAGLATEFYQLEKELAELDLDANQRRIQAEFFNAIAEEYASIADRLINYATFDHRVFDLAQVMRKRLSEFQLKLAQLRYWLSIARRRRSEASDGLRAASFQFEPAPGERDDDIDAHPDDDEDPDPAVALFPELARSCDGRLQVARDDLDRAEPLLDKTLELTRSLTDEGAERIQTSTNMVLYWLALITAGFGVLTLYDKYLSSDTFGLPTVEGFTRTFVLVVPMVAFLLLVMLRHGAVTRGLASRLQAFKMRVVDLVLTQAWFLPGPLFVRLKQRWVGLGWQEWIEWKLTRLVDGDLATLDSMSAPDADDFDAQRAACARVEERAERLFDDLWSDLEQKHAHFLAAETDFVPSTIGMQLQRLRVELMVNIAMDFLWLEFPRPTTSIPIYACMQWKTPLLTGLHVHVGVRGNLEEYIHTFDERADSWSLPERGIHGRELRRRYRSLTLDHLRQHWEDCDLDDDALWSLYRDHVIEHDGLADLPEALDDALDGPLADEVIAAYAPLRLSALLEDIGPDTDDDPDGADAC
jgi:hypothetical protein